jgi:methylamine--corrinoid protein Co-methyltransferase
MSNRVYEISERALKGPLCKPSDFDRMITKKIRSLIKEYDITYDPKVLIPTDNSLIDDVYKAGVDLFLELGALCLDTERRILFTEEELKEVLSSKPEEVHVGLGDDARVVRKRKIEDRNPPFILGGPTGTIVTEGEIFVKHHQGICQEPVVDAYQAGALSTIEGRRIIKGRRASRSSYS